MTITPEKIAEWREYANGSGVLWPDEITLILDAYEAAVADNAALREEGHCVGCCRGHLVGDNLDAWHSDSPPWPSSYMHGDASDTRDLANTA